MTKGHAQLLDLLFEHTALVGRAAPGTREIALCRGCRLHDVLVAQLHQFGLAHGRNIALDALGGRKLLEVGLGHDNAQTLQGFGFAGVDARQCLGGPFLRNIFERRHVSR